MNRVAGWIAFGCVVLFGSLAHADDYEVRYRARIRPDSGIAVVSVRVVQQRAVLLELSASLDGGHWFDFEADGTFEALEEGGFRWLPPESGGTLRYSTRIDRLRDAAEYDSRCTPRWMVTRAEDLFPSMAARFAAGAQAKATLEFEMPPGWSVTTALERKGKRFLVEQPDRSLGQPRGWIAAGNLDQLEEEVAGTRVLLGAPASHNARLRDALTFLRFVMPPLAEIVGGMPGRVAVVMADDPMWRGGLAGPSSLYLHSDRPLVDEDGTSPLIHELVHVITHARSTPGHDWIVEGLAEFYSLELLRRSGAVSQETHEESLGRLRKRGRSVREFYGESAGAQTARAVTLMDRLDRLIREATDDEASLDPVLEALSKERTALDVDSLAELIERTTGVGEPARELLRSVPTRVDGAAQPG